MKPVIGKTYFEELMERITIQQHVFDYLDSHPDKDIFTCLAEILGARVSQWDVNELLFLKLSTWIMYRFYKAGMKVFSFSPDLLQLLTYTSLEHVDTDLIRLPFDAIFINNISPLDLSLRIGDSTPIPVQSVFVTRFPMDNHSEFYDQIDILKLPRDKQYDVFGIYVVPNHFDGDNHGAPTSVPFVFPIADGDIYEYVKRLMDHWTHYNRSDEDPGVYTLMNIIINCILYINSSGASMNLVHAGVPDVSRLKNKKKIRKATANRTRLPYYEVGRDIVISRQDREMFARSANEHGIERHTLSWLVRGHWRNQPIGEGRKERKLIWIKPFRKGDDMAELIGKKYQVK
jgi:hypothetical protein